MVAAATTAMPALASPTTFTMTVGGVSTGHPTVSLSGHGLVFTNTVSHQSITCATYILSGPSSPGSALPFPSPIASPKLTSSTCTNPIAGSVTLTPLSTPTLTIAGPPTGTLWPASLTGISVKVTAAGCTFITGGSLSGAFNPSTQTLTPGTSTLTITATPVGAVCSIIGSAQGQAISVAGYWTASPTIALSQP
jgi:hypothetical protein